VSGVEYLDVEDALSLIRQLGIGPIRDLGLLDSSLARPRSAAFGQDAYPTLALKAAALLHSVVRNHSLVDGNKRFGWLATVAFLDLNRGEPDLADDAVFDLVIDVAIGTADVEEIAERLREVACSNRERA
jgi:death on curing protein